MRHTLIIGGNRFMGYQLVWRLLAAGEQVTTLNRGNWPDPFGHRIERLHADRRSPEFAAVLRGQEFDAAVDFAAFHAQDAQSAVEVLRDRVGHYIFISSGAVYMVREGASIPCAAPLSEGDYAGRIVDPPTEPEDLANWQYGAGKREAEDVLAAAWSDHHFPATCLRLPTVNGERDPSRRMESYLWRILDGGPVLLPEGGSTVTRHVYSGDVVKGIVGLMGRASTFGEAYNLSQDEQPTVGELVRMLAGLLGAPDHICSVEEGELLSAGLVPRDLSPFSGRWSSRLDGSRAKSDLGFQPEPLAQYLGKIVAAFLSDPPDTAPEDYRGRAREIAFPPHRP